MGPVMSSSRGKDVRQRERLFGLFEDFCFWFYSPLGSVAVVRELLKCSVIFVVRI